MCIDTDKYKNIILSKKKKIPRKIHMIGFHFYEVPKHVKLINIPFGDTQCVIKTMKKEN